MPSIPSAAQHAPQPFSLLDPVQQRLAQLLGPRFTVVLAGSVDRQGREHYHLALQHNASGVSLEDSGRLEPACIERLLALGAQARAMLDSPEFARMLSGAPNRPLVWMRELR